MAEPLSIVVDPDKKFARAIQRAIDKTGDLTIPFTLMTKDWFKGNRAIFALKGPGKYKDLSTPYKKQKLKAVGFIYPILKRSGQLERSLTVPGDPGSIAEIVNKVSLILGSRDRTATWHQGGSGRGMPARPFVLAGPEQVAPDGINRRTEAWIKIIEDYVRQVAEQELSSK